jgi:hypothetical protein
MAWTRKSYARSTTVLIGTKATDAQPMPFMLSAILARLPKTAGKQTAKRLNHKICKNKGKSWH